jgi:hypothetical protein
VGEKAPAEVARADLLALFSGLSSTIWQVLSPLIGNKGVSALMGRSLRLAAARHPFLRQVVITSEGIAFTSLQGDESLTSAVLYDGLLDLFCTAMDLLCSLIGIDLVQPMLENMERFRKGQA